MIVERIVRPPFEACRPRLHAACRAVRRNLKLASPQDRETIRTAASAIRSSLTWRGSSSPRIPRSAETSRLLLQVACGHEGPCHMTRRPSVADARHGAHASEAEGASHRFETHDRSWAPSNACIAEWDPPHVWPQPATPASWLASRQTDTHCTNPRQPSSTPASSTEGSIAHAHQFISQLLSMHWSQAALPVLGGGAPFAQTDVVVASTTTVPASLTSPSLDPELVLPPLVLLLLATGPEVLPEPPLLLLVPELLALDGADPASSPSDSTFPPQAQRPAPTRSATHVGVCIG
jgi:hypothetical protein